MLSNKTLFPTGFSSPGAIQASTGTSGNPAFNLSPTMLGFYFEDDWRATPRLLLNLGLRYDREIGTYGIDDQANSRTHQELVAAAKTGVATVPTTPLPPTGVGYTPSLGYLGGDYTGLPSNDNLELAPASAFPSIRLAMAALFSAAVTASTSAKPSKTSLDS